MQQVKVLLAWNSTGHVCDENAVRITNSEDYVRRFESVSDAKAFCESVLYTFPFLECYVQTEGGCYCEELRSDAHLGQVFRLSAMPGKYRVRLYEFLSGAHVTSDGEYINQDANELIHEFDNYRTARRFANSLMKANCNIEPWIYGPDGAIMRRAHSECQISDSGDYTIPISWWRSLRR